MTALIVDTPRLQPDAPSVPKSRSVPVENIPALRQQVARLPEQWGCRKQDIYVVISVYVVGLLSVAGLCAALRLAHLEAWVWGQHLLNKPLAVAGISLLLVATCCAAAAAWCARRGRRIGLVAGLGLAVVGCGAFIGVTAADLGTKWANGVRPAERFQPSERYVARRFGVKLPRRDTLNPAVAAAPAFPVIRTPDIALGRKVYASTCMTCHGLKGEGLPGQGKSLIDNEFVAGLDDANLLAFLKAGRQPWDPLNTTKVQMPPRGGNPMLTDDDLRDVGAFLRTLHAVPPGTKAGADRAGAGSAGVGGVAGTGGARATGTSSNAAGTAEEAEPALLIPRWVGSLPPTGAKGLAPAYARELARVSWRPPADGAMFANGYFLATQFGMLHAAAVAVALLIFLVQAVRGRIPAHRCGALALGATSCVVMTACWLLLFPLIYL